MSPLGGVGAQFGGALPRGCGGLVASPCLGSRSSSVQLGHHGVVGLVDRRGPVPGPAVGVLVVDEDGRQGRVYSAPVDAGGSGVDRGADKWVP
jgi:hypothetical protein